MEIDLDQFFEQIKKQRSVRALSCEYCGAHVRSIKCHNCGALAVVQIKNSGGVFGGKK